MSKLFDYSFFSNGTFLQAKEAFFILFFKNDFLKCIFLYMAMSIMMHWENLNCMVFHYDLTECVFD
jgi:hypothetical protein